MWYKILGHRKHRDNIIMDYWKVLDLVFNGMNNVFCDEL